MMGYTTSFFNQKHLFVHQNRGPSWQALFEAPALILLLKGLGDEGALQFETGPVEMVIYPAIKWWIFPWLCEAKYQRLAGTLEFNGIEWELYHGIEWE
jgi:hypothetical protein